MSEKALSQEIGADDDDARRRQNAMASRAQSPSPLAEIARLKGEMRVMADLLDEAWKVIYVFEGEDASEDEALSALRERMERASLHVRLSNA